MVNINLLSKEEKEEAEKKGKAFSPILASALMILIIVGLIILSLFIYQNARKFKISGLDKNIENLQEEIDKNNKLEGEEETLEQKAKTIQSQLTNLKKILFSHTYWSYLLTELSGSTHKEVQYNDFSVDDKNNTITISGNTSNYITLAYFLTSLSKSEKIENVQLNSAGLEQNEKGETVTGFIIKISLSQEALEKEE